MQPSSIVAVVFDWAGVMVDHGCQAPAAVFAEVFASRDVPISEEQARGPMGLAKRDHIAAIIADEDVASRWESRHGKRPDDSDVEAMYQDFLPLQKQTLAKHGDTIPGSVDVASQLTQRGVRVGSSTGYTRELMEVLAPLASSQGYSPQALVCSDDILFGRPAPWMFLEALHRMNADPAWRCLKVDDTIVGVQAGSRAGAWSVGVTLTGNTLGWTREQFESTPEDQRQAAHDRAAEAFIQAGADYVIPAVRDLPLVIEDIERRLAAGDLPKSLRPQPPGQP